MTLREQQSLFVRLVAKLIEFATEQGYELTFGEAWRTPEQAALNARLRRGVSTSLHIDRLAIDLNLFIGGKFITDDEGHKVLGEYWKTLHSQCRWGGDIKKLKDFNHYSMSPDNRI